jgi:hypothetical protein
LIAPIRRGITHVLSGEYEFGQVPPFPRYPQNPTAFAGASLERAPSKEKGLGVAIALPGRFTAIYEPTPVPALRSWRGVAVLCRKHKCDGGGEPRSTGGA